MIDIEAPEILVGMTFGILLAEFIRQLMNPQLTLLIIVAVVLYASGLIWDFYNTYHDR